MKCFLFVLESNGIEHEKETLPKFKQMEETPADVSVELQENGDMEQHQQASASDAADSELEEQKICDSEEPETKEIHENFKPVNETIYEETPDDSDKLQDNDDLEQHQQAVDSDAADLDPINETIYEGTPDVSDKLQDNDDLEQHQQAVAGDVADLDTENETIYEETPDVSYRLQDNDDLEQHQQAVVSDVYDLEPEEQSINGDVDSETEEIHENLETEKDKINEETSDISVKLEGNGGPEQHRQASASDVACIQSEDQRTEEMRENYEPENEKVKEEIQLEGEKMEEIESVEITPDIGVKTEYDYAQEEHGYFLATAAVSDAAKTTCDVCNKERIINTL